MSEGIVPDTIRSIVIDGINHGFRTGYRRGHYFCRDYSLKMNHDKEKLALKRLKAEVEKGFCLGPKQCPFPNAWSNAQPIICQLFFRPKHKWRDDNQFRLIGNKSYPTHGSFNDLIARADCKQFIPNYSYFTFHDFIMSLERLGRNTLMSLFDVKDAFKNCRIRPDDLWAIYKYLTSTSLSLAEPLVPGTPVIPGT